MGKKVWVVDGFRPGVIMTGPGTGFHQVAKFEKPEDSVLGAAAPDMLEALKALTGAPEYDGELFSVRVKMATDAIARATGAA